MLKLIHLIIFFKTDKLFLFLLWFLILKPKDCINGHNTERMFFVMNNFNFL